MISIRGNRATLSSMSDNGEVRSRELSAAELHGLRGLIREQGIDDLPLSRGGAICGTWYEYVHLTRDGGARVSMDNPEAGTAYDEITRTIEHLAESGPAPARGK